MAEQLNIKLGLDATPLIQGATQATQQVKTKFDTLHSQIKSTMAQPIQMELQLKGDKAEQRYRQLTQEIKNAKEAQHKLNLEGVKARKSAEIQRQLSGGIKVTAQQLEKAKGALQRMLQGLDKNSAAGKRLQGELAKINQRISQIKAPQGLNSFFSGLAGKLTLAGTAANLIAAGVTKAAQALGGFIQTGAGIEVLKLQLEAFTGSSERAEQMYSEFLDIAAKTPFNLEQVAQAGRTLLAFGVEANKAIRITEQLGVVAGSTGGDLNNLARNMGQIAAQGQAYTRDLTQFAMQGIPIWEEMSRVTGASVVELKKMAAEGRISFDIVEQALSNMTAKGTAFQRIGEQIGDTWIGKIRQIESGIQNFAGALTEAVTNLDNAFLGMGKGVMQAFADGLNLAAENANNLVAALAGVTMGIGSIIALKFVAAAGSIGNAIAGLVWSFKLWAKGIWKAVAAKIALLGLSGPAGWATIAAGVGIAVAAYAGLSSAMNNSAEETKRLKEEQKKAASQASDTSTALGMTYEKAAQKYKEATPEMIAELKKLETEKIKLIQKQETIKKKYMDMKAAAETAFKEIKSNYEKEKGLLSEQIADLERKKDALDVMGPAQRKLAELSLKELEHTAKTGEQLKGHITDRERAKLQAQAQLEEMKRQKKISMIQEKIDEKRDKLLELQLQYAKDKREHDEKMAGYAKDQAKEMGNVADALGTAATKIEELVDEIRNGMGPGIKESKHDAKELAIEVGKAKRPIGDAATAAGTLSSNLGEANTNAMNLSRTLANMPKPPSVQPSNFAGGPIKAGTTSYVNELGKEAFLSASGKLSMINAPAWGSWTAPSNGTIIPAHLTKQLDIPTGGINLNKAPGANASVGRAVRTVQAASGDVFNQNVTVQAANPVQAANNMMVEMTRLRRRRLG